MEVKAILWPRTGLMTIPSFPLLEMSEEKTCAQPSVPIFFGVSSNYTVRGGSDP